MSGPWEDFGGATEAGPWADYQAQKPPVTAKDRLQAGEGGFLKGAAYLATLAPDTIANAFNLGKAAIGTGYHALTGNDIPSALEVNSGVSPVGNWLTRQMDKSPITTTQPARPDDTASRYLSTAASVMPGILSGSGTPAQLAKVGATAIPPALAGQYVAEKKPFGDNEAANNAATLAATLLTGAVMPRGRGPDVKGREEQNQTIRDAQELGLKFPPNTTNPGPGNRVLESIAGQQKVAQTLSVENQNSVNSAVRQQLRLPDSEGPLTADEFAMAKKQAAPAYDAIRNFGIVRLDGQFPKDVDAALAKQAGAASMAASLRDPALQKLADELKANKSVDAAKAVDTIQAIRELKDTAYGNGQKQNGAAYNAMSKAIEDAVERSIARRGQAGTDLLNNYRDARRQFAVINSAQDAWNPGTGNIVAHDLVKQHVNGEPLSGNLLTIAKAAGLARRSNAFAEPTKSTGTSHLGLLGSLLGGAALAHETMGSLGSTPLALAAALQGSREGANAFIKGPGQSLALQTQRAPVNPLLIKALMSSTPATINQ